MITYTLEIHTPGRLFFFKNVSIRTPTSLVVTSKQLQEIKIQLHAIGITKYSIHETEPKEQDTIPPKNILNKQYEIDKTIPLSVPEIETLLRFGDIK
jgi:hypothetical protein